MQPRPSPSPLPLIWIREQRMRLEATERSKWLDDTQAPLRLSQLRTLAAAAGTDRKNNMASEEAQELTEDILANRSNMARLAGAWFARNPNKARPPRIRVVPPTAGSAALAPRVPRGRCAHAVPPIPAASLPARGVGPRPDRVDPDPRHGQDTARG